MQLAPEIVNRAEYTGIDRRRIPEGMTGSDLPVSIERRENQHYAEVLGRMVLPDRRFKTQLSVREEACKLLGQGHDVAIIMVDDPEGASDERRAEMDNCADWLTHQGEDGARFFEGLPAMRAWAPFRAEAIALQPLYGASGLKTLGEGIDPGVFSRPLITDPVTGGRRSALDTIAAYPSGKAASGEIEAAERLEQYKRFIDTPIDTGSRLVYMASRDGEGIRSRAVLANMLVREHFGSTVPDHGIRAASLACGAATPAYAMLQSLEKDGHTVESIDLLDVNPMALAAAYSLGESQGMASKLTLTRKDLLRSELTDVLPESSVDMVDMLGLFEYISNRPSTKMATRLLERTHSVMRNGGVILVGNMLADRDQQEFFEKVVRWPRLYQRTISETLGIIRAAGLDAERTRVRISARDGIYAVYAIPVSKQSGIMPASVAGQAA